MDKPRDEEKAATRGFLHVLAGIVGSLIGSLLGGVLGFLGAWAVVVRTANGNEDAGLIGVIILCPPAFLLGATIGAAVGATIMQRALRRRSSFWRALLGAVAGLLAGVFVIYCLWRLDVSMAAEWWEIAIAGVSAPIAAGAVIGSGWKAKTTDAAGTGS
jgi:hypothetical protein